jgi:hypothetical protein
MARRLYIPREIGVEAGEAGVPNAIEGVAVETVREEWMVEDRWWSEQPLRRRYFEVVLANGSDVVVFRELVSGKWFSQRA